MSNDIVIRVEKLSKRYKLGLVHHDRLADALTVGLKQVGTGIRGLFSGNHSRPIASSHLPRAQNPLLHAPSSIPEASNHIWALKEVSFQVKRGEVLGIIGRNGAGKSTLLKVLTGITDPTEGRVWMKGRVASLLEVGTGFHSELTGRENIYLNGSILGMTRVEINKQFDKIVSFAEIEKFIDTPVKRYSSGMYVRLAFAVSAHLEPEILLVDEVLAVGDLSFQKKCIGKMSKVASQGRTVLFVSHNMNSIIRLCQQGVLLDCGALIVKDHVDKVVGRYLESARSPQKLRVDLSNHTDRSGDGTASIIEASIQDIDGNLRDCFCIGESIILEFIVVYLKTSSSFSHSIEVINDSGTPVYHLWDIDSMPDLLPATKRRVVRATIHNVNLFPDRYHVTLWVGDTQGVRSDKVSECLSFNIENTNSKVKRSLDKSRGLIYKTAHWFYKDA